MDVGGGGGCAGGADGPLLEVALGILLSGYQEFAAMARVVRDVIDGDGRCTSVHVPSLARVPILRNSMLQCKQDA